MDTKLIVGRAIEIIVFLFSAFGGFLFKIAPPTELNKIINYDVGIVLFISLIILLFISGFGLKFRKKKVRLWIIMSTSCFVLFIASSFLYQSKLKEHTLAYPESEPDSLIVIGKELTKYAHDYKNNHPNEDIYEVVSKFGGIENKYQIWKRSSITRAETVLSYIYVITVFFLVTSIFSLVEFTIISKTQQRGSP